MNKVEEFKNRATWLIKLAKRARERYLAISELELAAQAQLLIDTVKVMCEGVESGSLLPSDGVGFGLSRAVGEWAQEHELVDAAYDLEKFYREELEC